MMMVKPLALRAVIMRAKGLNDHRRQAFRNFVEQQKACPSAQDAAHSQHLLLAARQAGAWAVAALEKVGEHLVDFFNRHAVGGNDGWQQQGFLRSQCRKNATLFPGNNQCPVWQSGGAPSSPFPGP